MRDPAALRRAADVFRHQIVARNELAGWLGDALDSLRVLRGELAVAREALAAESVECDALRAELVRARAALVKAQGR